MPSAQSNKSNVEILYMPPDHLKVNWILKLGDMHTHNTCVQKCKCVIVMFEIAVVLAILKKNFKTICQCIPNDYETAVEKLNKFQKLPNEFANDLKKLDYNEEFVAALFWMTIINEVDVLNLCEVLEHITDSNSSKDFIKDLRSGKQCFIKLT